MDYLTNVLSMFLDLDLVRILAVYGGSESSQDAFKYLNLCSEDNRRFYGFGTA